MSNTTNTTTLALNVSAVERRRIELGLTKQELARRAGITAGRYTQMLQGALEGRAAFAPTAKALGTVLGLSVSELFVETAA